MTDRRHDTRPDSTERRTFPRPPLWLNLTVLLLALATFAFAKHQRDVIREKTTRLFQPSPASPAELNRIREELADMDVTREQLSQELDARMELLQSVKSAQFYIAVDTSRKRLMFRLGEDVVREAPVTLGEKLTVTSPDGKKTWTFIPVKGAFNVVAKDMDYDWRVPEWLRVARKDPTERTIRNGLGRYVIVLPDHYIIHSPPPPESPLAGSPKPGSIMVPEEDLAAIWPRITKETKVYIF